MAFWSAILGSLLSQKGGGAGQEKKTPEVNAAIEIPKFPSGTTVSEANPDYTSVASGMKEWKEKYYD